MGSQKYIKAAAPDDGSSNEVELLKKELELLTSFSTDTIYRLRYDTMEYDYISPAIQTLLGFSVEEMKKISLRELIIETRIVTDGMDRVESFSGLEQRRKDGDVNKWQADYLMRTKDGRKIWVYDVSHPWFDEKGRVIGSVGSLRDVTDRVEAENKIKEEFSKIANTDALTDLPNRREFFDRLERDMTRLRRVDSEVSILVLDIDHFKKINDTYGHDVGDSVLIEISKVINSCMRETDLASRIGGEEFGVLLPDTPVEGAGDAAERIRGAILKHNFELGHDKKPVAITVSIGVATAITGQDITTSELYKIADTRLYIAKNSGRNQTSVDHIQHTH
jgi:diguanylate cyclase (GGDEF)-like protein/PAS domain S-box-containing protein